MPDVDWLTGISSRAAFARQVGQADQDRDQFAVAIIGIRHIDDINRHLGFQVGDDLLRIVGRTLGDRVAVGTTVARLGGARFGMMTVGLATQDVGDWLEPVAAAINNAIAGWIFDQIDFHGSCLIEPTVMIGAAGGYSGRVWADATVALDLCEAEPGDGGQVGTIIVHDPTDSRFAAIEADELRNETVRSALKSGSIRWARRPVERCDNPDPLRPWTKIEAIDRRSGASIATGRLRSAVGLLLERAAVEQAAAILGEGDGQLRVTVRLSWLLRHSRSIDGWFTPLVTDARVPPSRFVFEFDEADVVSPSSGAIAVCTALADRGAELVLAGCRGGMDTVTAINALPIRYLAPAPVLNEAADDGDRSAIRVLTGLIGMARDVGGGVIFPDGRPGCVDPEQTVGYRELEAVPLGQVGP
ncbi:MAG: diguanylate cyclase [Actinomycetota bacterium]